MIYAKNWGLVVATICIGLTALAGSTAASPAEPAVALANAFKQAKEEKKLILLNFISYNSMDAKLFADAVLNNPDVKKLLLEQAIVVQVEVEADPALKARYAVNQIPLTVIMRSDGTEVERLSGMSSPARFLKMLRGVLAGQPTELAMLQEKAQAPNAGVEVHMALAQAYSRRAAPVEAAAEYEVCLDLMAAATRPMDMRAIKTVWERLLALGREVPTVNESVKARRENLEKRAETQLSSSGWLVLFGLNEAAGQPERNVELYLKIPATEPARQALLPPLLVPLVAARHYAEVQAAVDLETFVNDAYPRRAALSPSATAHKPSGLAGHEGHPHAGHNQGPGYQALINQRIATYTVAGVEALVGTGRLETAKRLASRAMDFTADDELPPRLLAAAKRAGGTGADGFAQWLAQYPVPVHKEPSEGIIPKK